MRKQARVTSLEACTCLQHTVPAPSDSKLAAHSALFGVAFNSLAPHTVAPASKRRLYRHIDGVSCAPEGVRPTEPCTWVVLGFRCVRVSSGLVGLY